MFKPEFKERGCVRAVYVVDMSRCGVVDSTSRENAESRGNVWAVGKWYRDDEKDLQEKLDHDFNVLIDAYRKIGGNDYGGGCLTYEFKKYRS
jgi:co-chaperonin GroES (HSP10)